MDNCEEAMNLFNKGERLRAATTAKSDIDGSYMASRYERHRDRNMEMIYDVFEFDFYALLFFPFGLQESFHIHGLF